MNDTARSPGFKKSSTKRTEPLGDLDPATKIRHLRKRYGAGLAPEWDGESTLGELLRKTKFKSLMEYVKHSGRRPKKRE